MAISCRVSKNTIIDMLYHIYLFNSGPLLRVELTIFHYFYDQVFEHNDVRLIFYFMSLLMPFMMSSLTLLLMSPIMCQQKSIAEVKLSCIRELPFFTRWWTSMYNSILQGSPWHAYKTLVPLWYSPTSYLLSIHWLFNSFFKLDVIIPKHL